MTDDDIIDEARKFLELCERMDESRSAALDDIKFRRGDPVDVWGEEAARQRELDGRPMFVFNDVPAIIHRVTNDVRQNQQSIHVHPSDSNADPEVAKVIEGICRHIEYASGADAAYDTAVEYATTAGFGYFRLVTEYCDPMSFEQDMRIKRIKNPFTVYLDPGAEEADGSDSRAGIISTKMDRSVFDRDYPNRDPAKNYLPLSIGDLSNWIDQDYVRVAEYYRVEETKETLVRLSDGSARLKDDPSPLPPGVMLTADTRETMTRKIMLYKLTALEVLEKAEIPFDWIPIFPVYGDEIDIDGQTFRSGLVRYLKDPKRMEAFWMTSATEEIALRTKTPFIGALGQFENMEDEWNSANNRQFAYLEYNPVAVDGNLAPPPQRQAPNDVPAGYLAMAGMARDAGKAVTGIYDASLGQRSNETSGVAIRNRQAQGEIANFHIADNLGRAIRHLGRCIVSGIPRVYDTERMMRIVGEDGQHQSVEVNKPEQKQDDQGNTYQQIANDLTIGQYEVIVTSGPSYASLREESAAAMIELGGKWPALMEKAGDLVIRAMDWPNASKMADRIAPPGADDDDKNMVQTPRGPIPVNQAGQLIGQMNDTLEQMQHEMEQLEAGITKAKIDATSREEVARINNEGKADVEELKGMITLLTAQINPMLAHQAAVIAAADPEHPDAPAAIAQGLEQAPGDAAAADQQAAHQSNLSAQEAEQAPEPDAGTASAPKEPV